MTKVVASTLMLTAIGYTLIAVVMVWFTFAFFGIDTKGGDIGGIIGFSLFALSPIPVCIYCFRRAKALLNGERPKI